MFVRGFDTPKANLLKKVLVINANYNKVPITKLKINGRNGKFTVDTGSTINIIDDTKFKQLQNINLQKILVRAYPFNSSEPVQMTEKFDTLIRERLTVATIYVTAQDGGCLLNNTTAQELGLISFHLNKVDTQTKASLKDKETGLNTIKNEKVRNILHKHSEVFQDVEKIEQFTNVKPVAKRQRKIPFYLRAKVDSEINRLEQQDINE